MSAMTRCRADVNAKVGDLTIEYYTQSVSTGLTIPKHSRGHESIKEFNFLS